MWYLSIAILSIPKPKAKPEDIRVNQSGTEDLDPAFTLADSAALSAAGEAGDVDLCRGLGEWEVVGSEAYPRFFTEGLLCE